MSVRRLTIPLMFLGLGGLGAILFSERGRKLIRVTVERVRATPEQLAAWNNSAQEELKHIQQMIQELEQSLKTQPAQ